jgi:hypothetical protein
MIDSDQAWSIKTLLLIVDVSEFYVEVSFCNKGGIPPEQTAINSSGLVMI